MLNNLKPPNLVSSKSKSKLFQNDIISFIQSTQTACITASLGPVALLKYPPVAESDNLFRLATCSVICFWKTGQNGSRSPKSQFSRGAHPRIWTSASVFSIILIIVNRGITGGIGSRIDAANVCYWG